MPVDQDLLYVVSGFVVGVIVGLTGVGGGSLMTPLLVMAFGIHPKTAVGTDLLYSAITKIFGTAMHHNGKTVDWQIVRRLAYGSVPTTLLTILVLGHMVKTGKEMGEAISFVLGIALLLTSIATLLRTQIVAFANERWGEPSDAQVARWTVISGAVLGVLVSISSVGAGALGVTALLLIYPRVPTMRIVGSDIAHSVPLTLIAGAGHWWFGDVDMGLMWNLLAGSIPGIVLGSWLAPRSSDFGLRSALAAVLMAVGEAL